MTGMIHEGQLWENYRGGRDEREIANGVNRIIWGYGRWCIKMHYFCMRVGNGRCEKSVGARHTLEVMRWDGMTMTGEVGGL